jgi:hypothetical protein
MFLDGCVAREQTCSYECQRDGPLPLRLRHVKGSRPEILLINKYVAGKGFQGDWGNREVGALTIRNCRWGGGQIVAVRRLCEYFAGTASYQRN